MNPPYIERTGDVGGFDSHHRSSEQLETNHFQFVPIKGVIRWREMVAIDGFGKLYFYHFLTTPSFDTWQWLSSA